MGIILIHNELLENIVLLLKRPQMSLHKWPEIQIHLFDSFVNAFKNRSDITFDAVVQVKIVKMSKKEEHAVEEWWQNYWKGTLRLQRKKKNRKIHYKEIQSARQHYF